MHLKKSTKEFEVCKVRKDGWHQYLPWYLADLMFNVDEVGDFFCFSQAPVILSLPLFWDACY